MYPVESSRLAYDGVLSRVRVDTVRFPDGSVAEREVVEHPGAVAVVAVGDDRAVVLVRQYRHAVGGPMLEVPAGKLDVESEDHAATARRELAEEVGLEADRWDELAVFDNSAGWTTERTAIFLATGLRACAAPDGFTATHEEADIEVVRVPLDEAIAMVERGELTDAKTVLGVLLAARRLERREAASR